MIRAAKISERLSGDEVPFDMRVIEQAKQFTGKIPGEWQWSCRIGDQGGRIDRLVE